MRKKILSPGDGSPGQPRGMDIASIAVVHVTSESEDHPVENAFDGDGGPGSSRWVAGQPGEQTMILQFDTPQSIDRITLAVEETDVQRTQELSIAVSSDGGGSYRELLRQEYTFAPPGTTLQREGWDRRADGVTHLRLWIKPDKGGALVRAKLSSLTLE